MKKAILTGLVTGIIISAILITGTYVRRFLPDTFTANLLFLILFFGSIVATVWLSLNHYCRNSAVKWMSLTITGVISSVIAAMLVSTHGFLYSKFKDPRYIDEVMKVSDQNWQTKNYTSESLSGGWTWFQTPANYTLYNFRDLMIVLFLISLTIAAIYYVRNRNKLPDHHHRNQELIF